MLRSIWAVAKLALKLLFVPLLWWPARILLKNDWNSSTEKKSSQWSEPGNLHLHKWNLCMLKVLILFWIHNRSCFIWSIIISYKEAFWGEALLCSAMHDWIKNFCSQEIISKPFNYDTSCDFGGGFLVQTDVWNNGFFLYSKKSNLEKEPPTLADFLSVAI